jgi:hypothetical protein
MNTYVYMHTVVAKQRMQASAGMIFAALIFSTYFEVPLVHNNYNQTNAVSLWLNPHLSMSEYIWSPTYRILSP